MRKMCPKLVRKGRCLETCDTCDCQDDQWSKFKQVDVHGKDRKVRCKWVAKNPDECCTMGRRAAYFSTYEGWLSGKMS